MSSTQSSLEILRSNANNLSKITLSNDGKTLHVTDPSILDIDATKKYTVPGTPDETAYSLASLYLLCLHPNSLVARKRACDKYGVDDNVKVTHRVVILTFFGLHESENQTAGASSTGTAGATNSNGAMDGMSSGGGGVGSSNEVRAESMADPDVEMMEDEMMLSNKESKNDSAEAGTSASTGLDKKRKSSDHSRPHGSKRREEEDRRKKHKDHHSSRKEKDRKDRSSRDRHTKKEDKYSKKDKAPITNEQVMQNLTELHGKREGDLKRKSTDLPFMDTTATNTNEKKDDNESQPEGTIAISNKEESKTNDSTIIQNQEKTEEPQNVQEKIENHDKDKSPTPAMSEKEDQTKPSSSSTIVSETEEERKENENSAITEALSATGFEFSDAVIAADRENTEKITAMETPVGDSASVLRFASRDFSRVLGLYMEVKRNEERVAAAAASSSKSKRGNSSSNSKSRNSSSGEGIWERSKSKSSSSSSSHPSQQKQQQKKVLGLPLIIVPNAMTSPIGMINANNFFANAKFIPRDRTAAKKVSTLVFKRRISSRLMSRGIGGGGGGGSLSSNGASSGEMEYELMDNPATKLSRHDWDRVVAVIAHGEKWQFKGWKWTEPVEIFSNCFGFYIGMEGAPIPKGLIGWNVKKAFLNRDKRGLDRVAHASFWNSLDEWMVLNKRDYLP